LMGIAHGRDDSRYVTDVRAGPPSEPRCAVRWSRGAAIRAHMARHEECLWQCKCAAELGQRPLLSAWYSRVQPLAAGEQRANKGVRQIPQTPGLLPAARAAAPSRRAHVVLRRVEGLEPPETMGRLRVRLVRKRSRKTAPSALIRQSTPRTHAIIEWSARQSRRNAYMASGSCPRATWTAAPAAVSDSVVKPELAEKRAVAMTLELLGNAQSSPLRYRECGRGYGPSSGQRAAVKLRPQQ
jgi:hypothetical protein